MPWKANKAALIHRLKQPRGKREMKLFLTKKLIEIFANEALLSEQEIMILRSIAKGHTRNKICEELYLSTSTIDKKINLLKQKYDYCASYLDELPDRSELQQFQEIRPVDLKPKTKK